MKSFAHQILSQLKEEYPLPPHIETSLTCFSRSYFMGNTIEGKQLCFGDAQYGRNTAYIRIGLNHPIAKVVDTVAHEYYHCIQKYAFNQNMNQESVENAAEYFAKKYTKKFLLSLSNIKVDEGYMDMPLPKPGQYPKGSGLCEYYSGLSVSNPLKMVNYDDSYVTCRE